MHRILISVLFASALTCFGLFGQAKEFAHPAIISFETGVFPASADEKSELNISGEHFKHGQKCLQWKWSETDATLSFVQNIPYAAQNPHGDNSVATFVFWLYSLRQLPEAKLVFEFLNLLLHPFLERITHHSPVLMLLSLVCIAALLVPLHHKLEHLAVHKLVEKNKQIRLAEAKKTIR